VWTKISKAIIVAARHGGGDPNFNLTLRYALDEARYANMPRDLVERNIQKGVGGTDTSNYETVRYEGYGPGGVAIVVDALTDNRTRTVTDVRTAFTKHGGTLGNSGSVGYMFQTRGQIVVSPEGADDDKVMGIAIEAGAMDVESPVAGEQDPPHHEENPDPWVVYTDVAGFIAVRDAIERAGLKVMEAQITLIPDTRVGVGGEAAKDLEELLEVLEDLDDVQRVHSNAQFE
jgi:YebC/PmpR family DNA-binding regulatory protein